MVKKQVYSVNDPLKSSVYTNWAFSGSQYLVITQVMW